MKKSLNFLIKVVIILLFIYTWQVVQLNSNRINQNYIYLYIALVIFSLLSDRYLYRGQSSEAKKEYQMTSYYLRLTWFSSLIFPLLEYAHMMRYNIKLTVIGCLLIIFGVIIRGLGIKTLGRFFSSDVESWNDQKIIRSGIYNHIRHPAYAGNILQVIAFPLVLNSYFSLVISCSTIVGFLWRIKVEEEFLINNFPEYKEYIEETKRIIPKVW